MIVTCNKLRMIACCVRKKVGRSGRGILSRVRPLTALVRKTTWLSVSLFSDWTGTCWALSWKSFERRVAYFERAHC